MKGPSAPNSAMTKGRIAVHKITVGPSGSLFCIATVEKDCYTEWPFSASPLGIRNMVQYDV